MKTGVPPQLRAAIFVVDKRTYPFQPVEVHLEREGEYEGLVAWHHVHCRAAGRGNTVLRMVREYAGVGVVRRAVPRSQHDPNGPFGRGDADKARTDGRLDDLEHCGQAETDEAADPDVLCVER